MSNFLSFSSPPSYPNHLKQIYGWFITPWSSSSSSSSLRILLWALYIFFIQFSVFPLVRARLQFEAEWAFALSPKTFHRFHFLIPSLLFRCMQWRNLPFIICLKTIHMPLLIRSSNTVRKTIRIQWLSGLQDSCNVAFAIALSGIRRNGLAEWNCFTHSLPH